MDDYLSKPVDRRLLEATLARWLQHRPVAAPAAAPAQAPAPAVAPAARPAAPAIPRPASPFPPRPGAAPAPAPAAPAVRPAAPVAPAAPPPQPAAPEPMSAELRAEGVHTPPPVLSHEVVDELKAVMGGEYLSLVRLFLEDAPKHVHALENAASANDMAAMVSPAHTLKSASANLGAMALSAAAKRIELGARQGVLPRPAVAVAVLESEFRRAQQALQALLK
jgi:HPt (histidine-containing phosphotransfer) domain-containing protein